MEEALVRILTPRRSIDILRDVHAAKEQRKPYVVVFVGVNGVGKSTNLAKVVNLKIISAFMNYLFTETRPILADRPYLNSLFGRLLTGFCSITSRS